MPFKIAALALAVAASSPAFAVTYETVADNAIAALGKSESTAYGQTFTLAADSVLNDWTFSAKAGTAGSYSFNVSAWDGSKIVGDTLYSVIGSYAGGAQDFNIGGIGKLLGSGTYMAYLSVAELAHPLDMVSAYTSSASSALGGGFYFLNSAGVDPRVATTEWHDRYANESLAYTANITPVAAVPEPESWALLLAGLGVMGFVARRKKSRAA